jgi:MaoC like domain
MTEFDPALHRMVSEQRWFEDFVLGERFVIPSRTMTAAVFAAFQTASGDAHPIHYDIEYCRARGMPNLLAHGFQTLIHTAPGGGIAGRLSRTVEPVLKTCVCRRNDLSGA